MHPTEKTQKELSLRNSVLFAKLSELLFLQWSQGRLNLVSSGLLFTFLIQGVLTICGQAIASLFLEISKGFTRNVVQGNYARSKNIFTTV